MAILVEIVDRVPNSLVVGMVMDVHFNLVND